MVYTGHVENGVILLDAPAVLPEGALVRVELAVSDSPGIGRSIPSLAESLAGVIGKAQTLPSDWSENHDKYLREEQSS